VSRSLQSNQYFLFAEEWWVEKSFQESAFKFCSHEKANFHHYSYDLTKIMRSTCLLLLIGLLITPLPMGNTMKSATAETPSISMATDMTRYVRGEMIKLVVTNTLDIPIWYIGYPQHDLIFWTIERAKDNGWHSVGFRLPLIEAGKAVCRIAMYEQPIGAVMELKPHSVLLYRWNQKICPVKRVPEPFEPETIESGRYRFELRYSLKTVKSEKVKTEPWKRPIELGETKVAYSNEFVLE
jgi:hypothetical protein